MSEGSIFCWRKLIIKHSKKLIIALRLVCLLIPGQLCRGYWLQAYSLVTAIWKSTNTSKVYRKVMVSWLMSTAVRSKPDIFYVSQQTHTTQMISLRKWRSAVCFVLICSLLNVQHSDPYKSVVIAVSLLHGITACYLQTCCL